MCIIKNFTCVEKHELVELLCTSHIPVRPKRGVEKLIGNFGGSVPNLARPEAFVNNLRSKKVLKNFFEKY